MTTIVYNHGILAADSRATHYKDGSMTDIEKVSNGEVCKIIAPTTLTLREDPIQAIGVAGDLVLLTALNYINDHDTIETTGAVMVRDIAEPAFYDQFAALVKTESFLVLVGKALNYIVSLTPDEGGALWKIEAAEKSQCIIVGTGAIAVKENLKRYNGKRELTMDDIMRAPARKIVQLAIVCDPHSGGDLKMWSEEQGHYESRLDPLVQAGKEIADTLPGGAFPVDYDDAVLDKQIFARSAEIEQERNTAVL